jgi:hypothetical protein
MTVYTKVRVYSPVAHAGGFRSCGLPYEIFSDVQVKIYKFYKFEIWRTRVEYLVSLIIE